MEARDRRSEELCLRGERLLHSYKAKNATFVSCFQEWVNTQPDKACIICEGETWSYSAIDKFSNKVANTFYDAGLKKGDRVCLVMENSVRFFPTWLGLAKIGVAAGLININLKGNLFLQSIKSISPAAIISDLVQFNQHEELHDCEEIYLYNPSSNTIRRPVQVLEELLGTTEGSTSPEVEIGWNDVLFYMFTSGSTGPPKAVPIHHSRALMWYCMAATPFHPHKNDVFYAALPLFHAGAGFDCLGAAVLSGATCVLRNKFSVSHFLSDCKENNVTAVYYLGEMIRYLAQQPPSEQERDHSIRVLFGAGIKKEFYSVVKSRFGVKQITECYSSTEGNLILLNTDETPGAIGSVSLPLCYEDFWKIVEVDEETGDIIRNPATGFAVRCDLNQTGEAIANVVTGDDIKEFHGYTCKEATEKKLLRNVFEEGDTWFRTEDLMWIDEQGYVYYHDRASNSFRWKGELFSLAEVEAVLSKFFKRDTVVAYKMEIPQYEGTAPAAAVCRAANNISEEELKELVLFLRNNLPESAWPILIRIVGSLPCTANLKISKTKLKEDGISRNQEEVLYVLQKDKYYLLDTDITDKIKMGKWRF